MIIKIIMTMIMMAMMERGARPTGHVPATIILNIHDNDEVDEIDHDHHNHHDDDHDGNDGNMSDCATITLNIHGNDGSW